MQLKSIYLATANITKNFTTTQVYYKTLKHIDKDIQRQTHIVIVGYKIPDFIYNNYNFVFLSS